MSYINFHGHSHYSPLDGVATPEEYAKRCKEIGMPMLSTTEHGTLSSHREFQRVAKENGLGVALGLEAYYSETDRFDRQAPGKRTDGFSMYSHLIVIAKNDVGLKNLQEMSRLAWVEGYFHKPRIDWELIDEYGEGLVILSGCMGSALGKAILDRQDETYAYNLAGKFKERFQGDYYIEMQAHNPPELNNALLGISDKLGIKPVSTEDCHHATPNQKELQEAFLILNTHPTKLKGPDTSKMEKMSLMEKFDYLYPDRKMTFKHLDIYLAEHEYRYDQYKEQGFDRPELFSNTIEIGEKIDGYSYSEGLSTLPSLFEDTDAELERLFTAGMRNRGLTGEEYEARGKRELEVIKGKGFSNYFIILQDVISWAKRQGIRVGAGRGSAAASLVCYALGITNINPIKHNLLFERFLDPERPDLPDVDVDFQDIRRDEVKQYLKEKYGNVSSISTITYYKGKSAIKDAARVLGVPYGDANKVIKVVQGYTDEEVIDEFARAPKTLEFRKKYPDVVPLARKLEGLIKGYGMHAAGLIISNKPITDYATVETRKVTGQDVRGEVVGLDYREAEIIGLVKMDLLGLKTLSVVDDCIKLVKERHGKIIDIDSIPMTDKSVYDMLQRGQTLGVFQCEAAPYTKLLMKMGCENFDDLAASNALIRPGAWNAIGEDYILKKKGKKKNKSIHPDVDFFMNATYDEVLFQEQLMQLCIYLAGFNMGQASKVRKGVGKKIPEIIAAFKEPFIDGASQKVSRDVAKKLWESFEASGAYAFNKAHSVSYSLLSYQTAWLKYHYPVEYMCSLLKHADNQDSITEYMLECRRLGIKVRLPHINKSEVNFSIEDDTIRFGLAAVKFISDKSAIKIIEGRPYNTYADFDKAVYAKGSGINTRMAASLNAIGGAVFDDNPLRGDEKKSYYEYLGIPAFENAQITEHMRASMRTLDEYDESETFMCSVMVTGIKRGDGWSLISMVDSTGKAGAFDTPDTELVKGNMYLMLISNNSIVEAINVDELVDNQDHILVDWLRRPYLKDLDDEHYKILYFAQRITKNKKRIATLVATDADKNLYGWVVFSNTIDKIKPLCKPGAVRIIETNNWKGTESVKDVY